MHPHLNKLLLVVGIIKNQVSMCVSFIMREMICDDLCFYQCDVAFQISNLYQKFRFLSSMAATGDNCKVISEKARVKLIIKQRALFAWRQEYHSIAMR